VKVCLAPIVLLTAAVPAFAQTDSDTNGTKNSHGFAVSDGDTVKFGRQRVVSVFTRIAASHRGSGEL
jgi:hypothetical protein